MQGKNVREKKGATCTSSDARNFSQRVKEEHVYIYGIYAVIKTTTCEEKAKPVVCVCVCDVPRMIVHHGIWHWRLNAILYATRSAVLKH